MGVDEEVRKLLEEKAPLSSEVFKLRAVQQALPSQLGPSFQVELIGRLAEPLPNQEREVDISFQTERTINAGSVRERLLDSLRSMDKLREILSADDDYPPLLRMWTCVEIAGTAVRNGYFVLP